MRKLAGTLTTIAAVAATLMTAVPARAAFSDVPSGYWAKTAIDYVADQHAWMRDFGKEEFHPEARLRRRHLARAAVRAFAPSEAPDPKLTFTDLASDSPFFEPANVAVSQGWMSAPGGAFKPGGKVPKRELDRVLVRALGLNAEVKGLNGIHTAAGIQLETPPRFAFLALAQQLGLHYNHGTSSEDRELLPKTKVRRADAAYALHQAVLARGTYKITALARYRDVTVGKMKSAKRTAAEFALASSGYPYVYAGEWHRKTPAGYCCGAQVQGGFDCSGFAWWVLREPGGGWDNTAFRPYFGWPLPERASKYMAKAAPEHLTYKESKPMDLMLFDGDGGKGWAGVDHAGIYLGKGWMIHSTGSLGGVGLQWVKDGWYRDHFVWSRRVIP
ncbi:MAG: C40 family peptidase [Actinomycetota bacterium]